MTFSILDPQDASASAARAHERAAGCALTIMAKAPSAGRVKTRLSPPLSAEQALQLGICFLRDTAENLAAVSAATGSSAVVSYTPVGEEQLFQGVLPSKFALIPQRGDDFGQRLACTAVDLFRCGFRSVCLIDGDSPTVPEEAYRHAVHELACPGDRVVLGPTADGGYYLIGLKQQHPELFEGIAWSTEKVYEQTLEQAQKIGLDVVELPLWYDVDDDGMLSLLRAELLAGMAPGFAVMPGYRAPHTRALLSTMDLAVNAAKLEATAAGGAADTAVDQQERPGLGVSEGR